MRMFRAFALYCGAIGSAWGSSDKVDVCHTTGNGGVVDLSVAASAQWAHLDHDDYLPIAFYADADGDGFGDPDAETLACIAPEGTVTNADDCDDSADFVNPDAEDVCGDGHDDDCSGDDALCSIEFDGWATTSGRIEPGPTPGSITGSYTFTRLSEAAGATRGGGGCMIADLFTNDPAWAGFGCTTNADCNDRSTYTGAFRYCASPHGSGEPRRCWTRPSDNCARSAYRVPGEYPVNAAVAWVATPTKPTTPGSETPRAPVSGDATGRGEDVRWMVVSCIAIGTNAGGCGSSDTSQQAYSYGPAYLWSAPE